MASLADVDLRYRSGQPTSEDQEFAEDYDDGSEPDQKLPVRVALTAAFLLFVGVLFGTIGLTLFFTKGLSDALPFLVIGGIGFLPGSYHVVILVLAYCKYPGYTYDLVPSYASD